MLLELRHDAPLLQLVHLPHRVQQHELVARVAGELLERRYILWEAVTQNEAARRHERVRLGNLERVNVAVERPPLDRGDTYPRGVLGFPVARRCDSLRLTGERLDDRSTA